MPVAPLRDLPAAILLPLALLSWHLVAKPAAGEQRQGVLIHLTDGTHISVEKIDGPTWSLGPKDQGIVVWTDGRSEAWQYVTPGHDWPGVRTSGEFNAARLFSESRGQGDASGSGPDPGQFTTQIDQLAGTTVFRGKSFLTPHNGWLLNPQFTIRRQPRENEPQFPAGVAVLKQGNTEIARIDFAEDQQKVAFAQIPELAGRMPEGLPAGEYSLRMEDDAGSSTFRIEDREWFEAVMEAPNRIGALLPNRRHPLYLQVAVETLLDQRDEADKPLAYLTDALDLLESVPAERSTAYLKSVRQDVLNRLQGNPAEPAAATLLTVGIPGIDGARTLIRQGKWSEASNALERGIPDEPRAQALATLHRAVILSQSGMGMADAAALLFAEALEQLQQGSASDQFLAQNNAGNFFLNQAQDRLYNHAFQMAAGGHQPLLSALFAWRQAESAYLASLALAADLDANQKAAVQVNLARLYALLADVILTLDVPKDGVRQFEAGEQAAASRAQELAHEVSATSSSTHIDPTTLASAEDIQSRLAFRRRDSDACLRHAEAALQASLEAGSLASVESIERLLGLYYARLPQFTPGAISTEKAREQALNHLVRSHEISEFLRDRIPADRIGRNQAGFFARRAYVNERIIELLIAKGEPAEALHYAELAKARSLQDLLIVEPTSAPLADEVDARTTREVLDEWPADVAAVEYFVGTETVWLFLIDVGGNVKAFDLLGDQLASREFIRDVREFLDGMDAYANHMKQRLLSGRGFDHQWQDELHRFYQLLMPSGVLRELQQAKTVVVIPHHLLHYFPFAALVTSRDERQRDAYEMVQPRFLIDESFNLSYAPSLSVWNMLRRRPDRPMTQVNAVAIVDFPGAATLPGVKQDLQNLNEAFGARVKKTLFGSEASESHVRPMLELPGMLLFATHGANLADQPLSSYLLLLPDQDNDGRLTAKELFTSHVRSDLIAMSACYTGLADRSPLPGDDLFGIQRAVLQSGARTVVSGLWDVFDDTAPELMKGFFERLATGQSAPKALAESQRAFLKLRRDTAGDPWLHPYFWAVYTAAGDDRTAFGAN